MTFLIYLLGAKRCAKYCVRLGWRVRYKIKKEI